MFTGLIQSLAQVARVQKLGQDCRLILRPFQAWKDMQEGESISVNGVCLTVESISFGSFQVYASAETLSRSTMDGIKRGELVNLERALALGQRMGGHIVQGHVDCVAWVDHIDKKGESELYTVKFPEEWSEYLVPKGSVALDGVSLTVNDCARGYLIVNIIPTTRRETNISQWCPGTRVNMETDIIAKYVRQMLLPWQRPQNGRQSSGKGVTEDFLREHGF